MSKKKVSGGSTTMTLKDFHGGSIPSDLPLPSAPGVILRPSDRPGFDRQGSWGNPIGRSSDHRLRPGSAGAVRNFDDKTPFLGPIAHIGRNFDEDERKPLDGVSGPRRTVSDDSIRGLPTRAELKPDYSSAGRLSGRQVSSQLSTTSYAGRVVEANNVGVNSHSARFAEITKVGVNSSNLGGSSGQATSGTYPNVWAVKEAVSELSASESLPGTWSAPNAASKLAHASALEKVSSGRWQSKQQIHHPIDVEVIRNTAIDSEFHPMADSFCNKSSYHPGDMTSHVQYQDAMWARHSERSLAVDDSHRIRGSGKELPTHDRPRLPMSPETIESNIPRRADAVRPACCDDKFVGSELQSPLPSEKSECPKLKIIPRGKTLESSEPPVHYNKQGYQQAQKSNHLENISESYGIANPTKSGLAGPEGGDRAVGRPKLNLRPRSQPQEPLQGNIERERNTVFGGARPRELVLKERGIDDVAVNNHDMGQSPHRVKQDVTRTEIMPTHATSTRYNEKTENIPFDNRIRRDNDRRDNRIDVERTDMQRRNWRSENRRNNRETEKNLHLHQAQDRPSSPETWRKPAEQPKPASTNASALRCGKAASAVELAQAFSRSVSDPKTVDRFPGQRSIPNRGQMPFSRLMDTTSRPQINGY